MKTHDNAGPLAIREQVLLAYSDCHGNLPFSVTESTRNLHFLASNSVTRDEAMSIMAEAILESYNEFSADLLKHLPADARITIAREGSVCIYVEGRIESLSEGMKADEWDYDASTKQTRIWWD